MPTATEYFGTIAHNLGPLTTTYTAPPSCATQTDHIVYANISNPYLVLGTPTCSWMPYGDCLPSGKTWDPLFSQAVSKFVTPQYNYYSPGLACPSGWKTAGILAHNGSGTFDSSSILALPQPEHTSAYPVVLPPSEFWLEILDSSETLAYCCPSGFQAVDYGDCISILGPVSSFTHSEVCERVAPFGLEVITSIDSTATREIFSRISVPGLTPEAHTTDWRLTQPLFSPYFAVATHVPAVPLIWKETDRDNKKDDNAEEASDHQDEHKTSASVGGDKSSESSASSATFRRGAATILGLAISVSIGATILLL